MLQNEYLLAKIGGDTAEKEQGKAKESATVRPWTLTAIADRNRAAADEVLAQVKQNAKAELQTNSVIADLSEPGQVLGAVEDYVLKSYP